MEKKNILIGKIGKSVKFKNLKIATGGDTCMILFSTMSRMNPNYNFYFCGPNDLNKLSEKEYDYMFPNHNVFSIFERNDKIDNIFSPILDNIEKQNLKFDFALMFCGFVSNINVPNFVPKNDGTMYSVLNAFKSYAGPYIYTLNNVQCPLYLISEDPRYITINAKDLACKHSLILSQWNGQVKTCKHIPNVNDFVNLVDDTVNCVYADAEKIFLMGIDKNWRESIDIDRKVNSTGNHCIIISNGHGTKKINTPGGPKITRLPEYKEWVIDNFKNTPYEGTMIYGKWSDEIYEQYPMIQDKKLIDLDDELADAKYTLIYSIVPGFVTIKPYEMICKGIIPFLHPDYDKNNLLNLPEYIYLKDKQDFVNKMQELDANPELYKAVLNDCLNAIKPEYLDGSYVVNKMFNIIANNEGFNYIDKEGVPSIFNHFNKDIVGFENINK